MAELIKRSEGCVVLAVILLLSFLVGVSSALTLFQIGECDGTAQGFGLADASYHNYASVFPENVVYDVGKSKLTSWPFIHPSTHDTWAHGSHAHVFTMNFTASKNDGDLYLHVGLSDTWTPPVMSVIVNGRELEGRRLRGGSGSADVAFNPRAMGKTSTETFIIPAGSLTDGANSIGIKLDDGGWVVYDYIQLSDSKKAPKPKVPEPPQLLDGLLSGAMAGFEEIVFANRQLGQDGHWYANFSYYAEGEQRKAYRERGQLCKLNLRTGKMTVLMEDKEGGVRDPQVHYDGKRIVFAYRKGGTDPYHLYEINADGTNLRQLTDGEYDDIEPTYMPDGTIVFCSSRCKRWVNCWLTQVAVLYRCDADGSNVLELSSNNEHENTPWPLPDGRILYQRWEYVDRSQVNYHHLWTVNPDGTSQMTYYGNLHPGVVMIDAKPIPNTDKVLSLFSPGHGKREHEGAVTIITPKTGPDDKGSAKRISQSDNYRDPWPFSEKIFMVAQGPKILLMDDKGQSQQIYTLPDQLVKAGVQVHEPRPIMPRKRERVIPDRIAAEEDTGKLILANVYEGRNMADVKKGSIKKLMILETLPKPINYTGGMDPLSYGGTFTLERIVGTVPVEEDGSAYMELPANRGLFFVAMDADGKAVKRMQSFLTVRPGETTSCVGCHEPRTKTPINMNKSTLIALEKPASKVTPITGMPDVVDFPRDIQPILDKHCLKCHDYDKRKGDVILTGDHGPMFSHSYATLTIRRQVADGRNRAQSNYPPYALGSAASPLVHKIEKGHHGVKLSVREKMLVSLWTDSGAAYPGTYAALGNGMVGGYAENNLNHTDFEWPSTKKAADVMKNRCDSCHTDNRGLPHALADEIGLSFWTPSWTDPRLRFSRHLMFNLSRPDKSVILLAPLAKEAGGYGKCKIEGTGKAVFESTDDEGYRAILSMCVDGKDYLGKIKRFDMPGFIPPVAYYREMKRYGVLPKELAANTEIDIYATDRAYWESLWYKRQ